jgi:KDO2-lipid IV(A) lauroyltransferase
MALKYEALLFPVYGIRQPDGLNYVIEVEAQVLQIVAATIKR